MSFEDTFYPLLRIYEAAPQSVKSLAGRAYRAVPVALRYGKAYARFQNEARESESWSPEDIKSYQVEALRHSLMAANEAPIYRERFKALGLKPALFGSLEQLAEYPLLTKKDLFAHREGLVNPNFSSKERLYITTGGSSGEPVGFYLQWGVSRPKEQAYMEAQWSRRGYRAGDKVAVVRGGVTTSHSKGEISYFDATRNWLVLSSHHLTADRAPEYVAALNRFRPRHLHMYPSSALMLARLLEQGGLKLDFVPVSILCGSEKLTPEAQEEIELAFGARVFHWYGHSERAVLAGQGRRSNTLYFWPAYGFVEFGEPDGEGFREVIGTSFHNHVMPLIRYRTGDFVKLERPNSEFGATEFQWPAACEVAGRDHEFLVGGTGRQVSLTALNMHDRIFDELYAVQFFQEQAGIVELRYQAGPKWRESREDSIREGLSRKLGDDFALALRRVSEVEKTPRGKAKWLVSLLKKAGE